jgi:hypothetical protein
MRRRYSEEASRWLLSKRKAVALAVPAIERFATSAICRVLEVARSNIAERAAGRSLARPSRPPRPDDDPGAAITAAIADLSTHR